MDRKDSAYYRGIDSTPATYLTDYIVGIFCLLYSMILLYCALNITCGIRKKFPETNRDDPNFIPDSNELSDQIVEYRRLFLTSSIMFLLCSIMQIAGGAVHQRVPIVEPENVSCSGEKGYVKDEFEILRMPLLPWYLTWELANLSGSGAAVFIFLLISRTVLCVGHQFEQLQPTSKVVQYSPHRTVKKKAENPLNNVSKIVRCVKRFEKVMYGSLFALFLSQLIYYAWNVKSYVAVSGISYESSVNGLKCRNNSIDNTTDISAADLSTQEKFDSLWTMKATTFLLGISIFSYACVVTYLTLCFYRITASARGDSGIAAKTTDDNSKILCDDNSNTNTSNDALLSESRRKNSSDLVTEDERLPCFCKKQKFRSIDRRFRRVFVIFCSPVAVFQNRCFGSCIFLISGIIQYSFSNTCGTNDNIDCPFPAEFNHNSIYHLLLGAGLTVMFLAESIEYLNLKRIKR